MYISDRIPNPSSSLDSLLGLDRSEVEALGRRALEGLLTHLEGLHQGPVDRAVSPDRARELIPDEVPEIGRPAQEGLEVLLQKVLPHMAFPAHRKFWAYVPGPGNFLGALGDFLASGTNGYGGTWMEGSAAIQVELDTIDWMARTLGLPETRGGVLLSGGSLANLNALAVARHHKGNPRRPRIYTSAETHLSVSRGARILGFRDNEVVQVESDSGGRIRVPALEARIAADRLAGEVPVVVAATAGTTSTGAVDDLPGLARVCQEAKVWLHVDAAHGGAAAFAPQRRPLLAGIEAADSVTLDPHKWLFQPYGVGALLVRDRETLKDLFSTRAAYLDGVGDPDREVNFFDYGPELSRPLRGLGLWWTLQTLGTQGLGEAIEHGFQLIEAVDAWAANEPWIEALHPPRMAITNLVIRPPGEDPRDPRFQAWQKTLVDEVRAQKEAFLATTVVQGVRSIRLCVIHPGASAGEVIAVLEGMIERAKKF